MCLCYCTSGGSWPALLPWQDAVLCPADHLPATISSSQQRCSPASQGLVCVIIRVVSVLWPYADLLLFLFVSQVWESGENYYWLKTTEVRVRGGGEGSASSVTSGMCTVPHSPEPPVWPRMAVSQGTPEAPPGGEGPGTPWQLKAVPQSSSTNGPLFWIS